MGCYSFAIRILGTALGMLFGVLVWYIGMLYREIFMFGLVKFDFSLGDGHGGGNPYGLAASFAVFILPLAFARAFAPPSLLLPVILTNVSLLVIPRQA